MTSKELYQQAYNKHYRDKDYAEALKDYHEVINLYPDSAEARYAKQQIPNVEKVLGRQSAEQEHARKFEEEARAKQAEENKARWEQELRDRERRAKIYADQVARLKQYGADGYYEYKVVKLLDSISAGCIDADELMNTLNQLGLEGWRLVSAYSNELGKNALAIAGFGVNSTADEHILIFERFQKI